MLSSTTSLTPKAVAAASRFRTLPAPSASAASAAGRSMEPPLGEARGVDIAQRHVGVGDGGGRAALAEGDGAGVRARAFGADADPAHAVDTDQRPAARADLDHLDHRDANRHAGALQEPLRPCDLEPPRGLGAGTVDEAELGRGAAHVEGKHRVLAEVAREFRGEDRAPGGPGFDKPDGDAGRRLDGGHAAARRHHEDRAGQPLRRETRREIREVAGHERLDIGVGDRGAEPVEFPRLGADLVAERQGEIGQRGVQGVAQAQLMGGVGVGVQKADGGGLDPGLPQDAGEGGHARSSKGVRSIPVASMRPPMVKARSRGTIRSGFCKSMAYWS
jgi:hypothetical protein